MSNKRSNVAFSEHWANFAALSCTFEALWLLFEPSASSWVQMSTLGSHIFSSGRELAQCPQKQRFCYTYYQG